MAVTIGQVMRHCRNYFVHERIDGDFVIANGRISDFDAGACQYIAIDGSAANNGVHGVDDVLADESFTGRVWLLAPPSGFVALADEIAAYDAKAPAGSLQSESFGNYSYSRGSVATGGWSGVFGARLADYQRLCSEVMV